MKLFLPALLACALLIESRAAETPLSHPDVGTTDGSGSLVIHVFNADSKEPVSVRLKTDYGVMMFRTNDGWVRFVLANKAKNSVREFTNYNAYLAALSELPKGSTLCIYDRCLMPTFYDFYPVHEELYAKFSRECRERGLKIAREPKIVCTCPANG
jgi:hypothetical protein